MLFDIGDVGEYDDHAGIDIPVNGRRKGIDIHRQGIYLFVGALASLPLVVFQYEIQIIRELPGQAL